MSKFKKRTKKLFFSCILSILTLSYFSLAKASPSPSPQEESRSHKRYLELQLSSPVAKKKKQETQSSVEIIEESRLLRYSLNLPEYDVDSWHKNSERIEALKTLTEKIRHALGAYSRTNVALCNIRLMSKQDTISPYKTFFQETLPVFFISGWPPKKNRSVIEQMLKSMKISEEFSNYKNCFVGDYYKKGYQDFKSHLKEYFPTDIPSRLASSRTYEFLSFNDDQKVCPRISS